MAERSTAHVERFNAAVAGVIALDWSPDGLVQRLVIEFPAESQAETSASTDG